MVQTKVYATINYNVKEFGFLSKSQAENLVKELSSKYKDNNVLPEDLLLVNNWDKRNFEMYLIDGNVIHEEIIGDDLFFRLISETQEGLQKLVETLNLPKI